MITANYIIELCEEVEFHIEPIALKNNIIYIKINGTTYGYKSIGVETAKEVFRKFSKMINMYGAGGKGLAWLKKVAKHVYGGEHGKPIPVSV